MKTRLNITIDKAILDRMKYYSERNNVSISSLIEEYFKHIIRKPEKVSLLDRVRKLPAPAFDKDLDLTKAYYDDKYSI